MIVLDTNASVYEPSRITDIVVAELLHLRARHFGRDGAADLAAEFVAAADDILPLTVSSRRRAIGLYAETQRISSNDALLAAVALEHDAVLISADQDFDEVPGLK